MVGFGLIREMRGKLAFPRSVMLIFFGGDVRFVHIPVILGNDDEFPSFVVVSRLLHFDSDQFHSSDSQRVSERVRAQV